MNCDCSRNGMSIPNYVFQAMPAGSWNRPDGVSFTGAEFVARRALFLPEARRRPVDRN